MIKAFWITDKDGKRIKLVIPCVFGKARELSQSDIMAKYSLDQIENMIKTLPSQVN